MHINLQLPDEMVVRLARVEKVLSKRLGLPLDRSKTIRYLLDRELERLEAELEGKGATHAKP